MQDSHTPPPVPPPPMAYQPRRRTWWWIPVAIIGGILVVFIAIIGIFVSAVTSGLGSKDEPVSVRNNSVLLLDLSNGLQEYDVPAPFNFGNNKRSVTLFDVLLAIRRAKEDTKIKGIYYRAGGEGIGYAKLSEVRDALIDFKTSGKFIYAYMEGGTKAHYFLASVADSIFMPQEALVTINAFGASAPFLRGAFDKLGVEWHVEQFEEYKSAAETMSRSNWTGPAKEELRAIVEQRERTFVDAIAASRKLDPAAVRAALDRGIFTTDTALANKFIDGVAMESGVRDRIRLRIDPKDSSESGTLRLLSINKYVSSVDAKAAEAATDRNHTVAIVYASGAIRPGKNDNAFDNEGIYAKNLIKELRAARDNDDISAIILRIDSPGGSAMASDEIWDAIVDIRKTKPVYASMSDVAASGGYYMAMACDTIIAHPSTITGSIGVISAIPNLSGTMSKIGVTTDTITLGRSAHFLNVTMPMSETDKKVFHEFGSGVYRRFVQKVADSRKKSFEETRLLARGRVWTGEAARANGLVDINGGLLETIKVVKKRLGIAEDVKVRIRMYPEKTNSIDALLRMLGLNDNDDTEENHTNTSTVQNFLAAVTDKGTPVEQVWKTLPGPMKEQVKHAATLTDLGLHEHTLVMLPSLLTND